MPTSVHLPAAHQAYLDALGYHHRLSRSGMIARLLERTPPPKSSEASAHAATRAYELLQTELAAAKAIEPGIPPPRPKTT